MAVRTKEQLSHLLKYVELNQVTSKRKNASVRQKIWYAIAQRLNFLDGPRKDVESWKRCYNTWRSNVGENYSKALEEALVELTDYDENYFYIEISDDDTDSDLVYEEIQGIAHDPKELQEIRLTELVSKHKTLLRSTADDEPLKERIWLNIAEQLNCIPGALKLSVEEWKERVEWNKLNKKRRVGKHTERIPQLKLNEEFKEIEILDGEAASLGYILYDPVSVESTEEEHRTESASKVVIKDDPDISIDDIQEGDISYDETVSNDIEPLLEDAVANESPEIDEYVAGLDDDTEDDEFDDIDYMPKAKRYKATPIVKSFKFSNRIVKAVETLTNDTSDIKNQLKQSVIKLNALENLVQQQCQKQEETNNLLRRNANLLKILVQCQSAKRKNTAK